MAVRGSLRGEDRAMKEGWYINRCLWTSICKHNVIGAHGSSDQVHGTWCVLESGLKYYPTNEISKYSSISSTKKTEFYLNPRPANSFSA